MPELGYALLCDFFRMEGGIAHIIAAGIDSIYAEQVPTGHNFGVVVQLTFTRNECGRPHRIELHLQDADGERIAAVQGAVTPKWVEDLPAGWRTRASFGLNFGVVFPRYGEYAMEVLVDDRSAQTLPLRVLPPQELESGG